MKSNVFNIVRYDADEGKVFDWSNLDEHKIEKEDGTFEQEHLYVKTLFIGGHDSIENYVEVEAPNE